MKHVLISLESGRVESVGPMLLIKANPVPEEVSASGSKLPDSLHNESPITRNFVFKISIELIDAFIEALDDSKAEKRYWEPNMDDYVLDKIIDFEGNEVPAYKHYSFRFNQQPIPRDILTNQDEQNKEQAIMNINEAVNTCIQNMKASADFNDDATVNSIKHLLQCVIDNPAKLIGFVDEEKASIALSSILTSQFPSDHPTFKDINVRNLVFATSFYLYMHQLETGVFYDRNWPAFITLIHYGRSEFAKFIVDTNPFAPERIKKITGMPVDMQRSIDAAKGLELNLMITAKRKGIWMEEMSGWYEELSDDMDELLEKDPFRKEAVPLYQIITNYLKENDVTFVNM